MPQVGRRLLKKYRVLDSDEPRAPFVPRSAFSGTRVLDSNEPLGSTVSVSVPESCVGADALVPQPGPVRPTPHRHSAPVQEVRSASSVLVGAIEPQPGPSSAPDLPVHRRSPLREIINLVQPEFEVDEPYVQRHLYSCEVIEMYNLARIIRQLCTREQCVSFAEEQGLIAAEKKCRVHRNHNMRIDYSANKNVGAFVCNKGTCRQRSKIYRSVGTLFENIKIDLPHVFYLMYCFAHMWPHDQVIREDFLKEDKQTCLSPVTITDWYSYCRETANIYQMEKQEFRGKIGGPGKIVQIDESKFGKRKYNRGRRVEGHWVLGLIEDGSEDLRLEVCPDNLRTSEVLIPFIEKHVEKGTTIHTDCWRAYDCLSANGYIHKKVNHSDPDSPFVNPEDGTHTQRIESQWRVVKRFFYKNNYNHPQNFAEAIIEYQWRRDILRNKKDPFKELLKAVKYVYKPK